MDTAGLSQFFQKELYIPELKSKSKQEVLEELVIPLVKNKLVKNDRVILETLCQRENLGSTGIGKHVAIPHCRTLAISNVYIVVGLSKEGIAFNSIDKKAVHLFFLIVAPPMEENSQYLPILGKLCELVNDRKIRSQLIKADGFDSFMNVIAGGK